MGLIVLAVVAALVVISIATFELVGWIVELNARKRLEKMTSKGNSK